MIRKRGKMMCFMPYLGMSLILGFMSCFPIVLSEQVFNLDEVLTNKNDFIRCLFMWQFAVYDFEVEYINKLGIIIVETLVSIVIFPANIITFGMLTIFLISKGICIVFYEFFKIKNDDESEK